MWRGRAGENGGRERHGVGREGKRTVEGAERQRDHNEICSILQSPCQTYKKAEEKMFCITMEFLSRQVSYLARKSDGEFGDQRFSPHGGVAEDRRVRLPEDKACTRIGLVPRERGDAAVQLQYILQYIRICLVPLLSKPPMVPCMRLRQAPAHNK